MKVIYNFTNIASHYRAILWSKIINCADFEYHFLYGKNKHLKINEIDFDRKEFCEQKHKLHPLKNYWLGKKYLIWQSGVILRCLFRKIDIAVFLGEFQVLSTWVAILVCKLRGIKIAYWTHGLYGNESLIIKKSRVWFYKLADVLFVYGRRSKTLLMQEGIKANRIKVIFNSLDYDQHVKLRNAAETKINDVSPFFENADIPYLVFVGRLTRIKKIELIIKAIHEVSDSDNELNLLIIGDGDHRDELIKMVREMKVQNYVHFFGACYDEDVLARLIHNAVLCVSPGNVGLTAIHALSYGTPVCTHNSLHNQMPEVEAITDGITGCFFEEDNLGSLVSTIVNWCKMNVDRNKVRKNCYQIIDESYNPYNQLEIIKSITGI